MCETPVSAMASPVAAVRRFSRFYTRQLGLLEEGLLQSAFSLTEGRVLYELATRPQLTASELGRDLGIDPGYLSRILKDFEKRGFVTRSASPDDGRLALLQLTGSGRAAFEPLELGVAPAGVRDDWPADACRSCSAGSGHAYG